MAKSRYTLEDLVNDRIRRAKIHREEMDNNTDVDRLVKYLNAVASGEVESLDDSMRQDGSYPWSDNEIASDVLTSKFPMAKQGETQLFMGRMYFNDYIRWDRLAEYDDYPKGPKAAPYTYHIHELVDARQKAQTEQDREFNEFDKILGLDTVSDCETLLEIESVMKEEGNYPWSQEERATAALSNLPPQAWQEPQLFNGLEYRFDGQKWIECEDAEDDDSIPF